MSNDKNPGPAPAANKAANKATNQPDAEAASTAPAQRGGTHSSIDKEPAPRMPHEHDESSDQQTGPLDPAGVQGEKDLKRGLVDTDRGKAMDETYQKQKKSAS